MKPTSGLDLLEQAFGLLRRLPPAAWIAYFFGTGLFWLGFLYFWEEMTQSPLAADHVGVESLLLAVLLLAMFAAQSVFSIQLRRVLEPGASVAFGRLLLLQCLVQPTKLVVLPAAAVALLPFAPVAAFYQHCAALRPADLASWRTGLRQAVRLTRRAVAQTWTALGLFVIFGALVWFNLFVLMAFLPELSRMLFGIESEFNRAGTNLIFSGTFFRISLAVTYCVLEPLWRAALVLRSFEGESISTGADLRRNLRLTAAAALLLCALPGQAAPVPIAPPQLDRSIKQTLDRPEFAWRTPRAAQRPKIPGWLEALQAGTRSLFSSINNGLRTFFEWLEGLVNRNQSIDLSSGKAPGSGLRTSSYLLIAACVALIAGLAIRQWRTQPVAVAQVEAVTPAAVELADETLLPTDRPEDEWAALGRDLLNQGETRLALRALYLGTLAYVARQQWIQVHRGKSNLDYLRELRRRAKGLAGVETSFADNLRIYERSWYGEHLATPDLVQEFLTNLERIKAHA